jgi:hypothetical protein
MQAHRQGVHGAGPGHLDAPLDALFSLGIRSRIGLELGFIIGYELCIVYV